MASSELPAPLIVRIPRQSPVSIVNLSLGGVLFEAPFALTPGSQTVLELRTPGETLAVPFFLLRCYVVGLKDGTRYHAAGAFERTLRLPRVLEGVATSLERPHLLQTLELFRNKSLTSDVAARGVRFSDLLDWVVTGLRRGDSLTLISAEIETQLRVLFPSVAICAKCPSPIADRSNTFQFFDLEFRSSAPLSRADRRFLRASAQLISLLGRQTDLAAVRVLQVPSWEIAHTATEWLEMCKKDAPLSNSVDVAGRDYWRKVIRPSQNTSKMVAFPRLAYSDAPDAFSPESSSPGLTPEHARFALSSPSDDD